ncbi:uncharacterized protein PITG_05744 [Phytophthora infestans T30-4]|uniref:Uncharacterized protein n=2 Tax=Phytophthora infestans TaxID=4787 RepID=D0N5K8_PHYIT|nr:uncharacterized protein PITG_05744 [Phytophthora infestans T30-4]EEY70349.1 hypothetical protein PITG_05744 [Phytophthora infestans T30-4]|eukprot:XP_002998003.1 hypothetical protein PITG_05744 [Phytophthora infestans T30-4]
MVIYQCNVGEDLKSRVIVEAVRAFSESPSSPKADVANVQMLRSHCIDASLKFHFETAHDVQTVCRRKTRQGFRLGILGEESRMG